MLIKIDIKNVEVVELDSLKLEVFFMKIDVEGFELDVLEGARSTIANFLPVILIEIQSASTFEKVKFFLGELGYFSVLVQPKANLKSRLIEKNRYDSYNSDFNNYVWVPASEAPSWTFRHQ